MDDIRTVRTKLLQCQAENEKLKAQLQGLITLVRKAWSGDYSAAVDVAKIVGISPPTLGISSTTDEIVAVPKPPLINNWSTLQTDMGNDNYKVQELIIKEKQLRYLRDQAAYIDEEMGSKKYSNKVDSDDVKQRINTLRDIVENENEKRKSIKKMLEKKESCGLSQHVAKKGLHVQSSHKKKASAEGNTKLCDINHVEDCLVVQARKQPDQLKPSSKTVKMRPKSAGWGTTIKKDERPKTSIKQRATSAKPSSILSPTMTSPGSAANRRSHSDIKHELGKTEKDIALAVELLQKRLGIENRGIV